MRRKLIIPTVLCVTLLTSCANSQPAPDPLPETTSQPEISETEQTETEPVSRLSGHYFEYKSINPSSEELSGYDKFIITDGNILYVSLGAFYNLNENTLAASFDPEDSWEVKDTFDGGKELLYKDTIFRWAEDVTEDAVCAVYTDRTFELAKETPENKAIQPYGIAEWQFNIVNAESGEVLIKGYNPPNDSEYVAEYGYDTSTPRYQFPLDETRFVYQTSGVKALACTGVYDLEKGEAQEIPNSADYIPLGARGGKIYLADGLYNFETDKVRILAADPDTLETEVYAEWSKNGDMQTAMSADGKYIALLYSGEQRLYVTETDTGEIFTADIEEEFTNPCPISFADSDTVVIANWGDKILLVDVDNQ
ncbi:MAG: hypothetical protein NC253_15980 [Ruminococcus sp.]|nr:hypothetical protein [Ruminococcus sp.]MCM1480837.1 hypothetical protein [Muribaculaceae bacterium]